MINAEILREAEQRRLAWRCRRGMLELDVVLHRFVLEKFHTLNIHEFQVFDELLNLSDTEFWSLILSETPHQDPNVAHLVALLNATHRAYCFEE